LLEIACVHCARLSLASGLGEPAPALFSQHIHIASDLRHSFVPWRFTSFTCETSPFEGISYLREIGDAGQQLLRIFSAPQTVDRHVLSRFRPSKCEGMPDA
jgi:hypothetical protein